MQRRRRVARLRRYVAQNRVEERRHVRPPLLTRLTLLQRRPAIDARCVDHREVQLLVSRAQLIKQIKGGIDHHIGVGSGLVDLVDHDDGLQAQRQRLLCHKPGLRHGALLRIDQQHHAIDHGQGALDLTAKVRVSRRVDDVDVGA